MDEEYYSRKSGLIIQLSAVFFFYAVMYTRHEEDDLLSTSHQEKVAEVLENLKKETEKSEESK